MTSNKRIVFAFPGIGKTRNPIQLAQMGKAGLSAGEEFMGIALMPHIKDNFVQRQIQCPMESHSQFNGTEV